MSVHRHDISGVVVAVAVVVVVVVCQWTPADVSRRSLSGSLLAV